MIRRPPKKVTFQLKNVIIGYDDYNDPIYDNQTIDIKARAVQPKAVLESDGSQTWSTKDLNVIYDGTLDPRITASVTCIYEGKTYLVNGEVQVFENLWSPTVASVVTITRTTGGK